MASGSFEYLQTIVVNGQLDVDDIGDCGILGRDDQGQEYYLITCTYMGWTEIIEYGPSLPDFELLPKSVTYKYNRIEYDEFKIEKAIDKFLNKNPISQAQVVDINEIIPLMKPMIGCIKK